MPQRYIAIHTGRGGPQVWHTDPRVDSAYCWEHDLRPMVDGFPDAKFKGFKSLNDAIKFASCGCTQCQVDDRQWVEVKTRESE